MSFARLHLAIACAIAAGCVTGAALAVGASPGRIRNQLDTTFADGGIASFDGTSAAGLARFGMATVDGFSGVYLVAEAPEPVVVRLTADGALDASFGEGGVAAIPLQASISDFEVAGGIVITGWFGPPEVSGIDGVVGAVRMLPDGSGLDPAFGTGGMMPLTANETDASPRRLWTVARTPSGDAFVAIEERESNSGLDRFGLVRFTNDGVLDATFAGDGFAELEVPYTGLLHWFAPRGPAVDSAGRIVVAGDHQTIRFLADGTRDLSFGIVGRLPNRHALAAYVSLLAIDDQDRIVALVRNSTRPRLTLGRYGSDGLPDSSFGTNGWITVRIRRGPAIYWYESLTLAGATAAGPTGSDRLVLAGPTEQGRRRDGSPRRTGWFATYVDATQSRLARPFERILDAHSNSKYAVLQGAARSGSGVLLAGVDVDRTAVVPSIKPFVAKLVDGR